MTAGPRGETLTSAAVTDRWRRLLEDVGRPSVCWRLDSSHRVEPDPDGPGPAQLVLREVFAAADPAAQRSLDLLCVALVERQPGGGDRPTTSELVVFGPEALRAQGPPVASGVAVADLRLGPAGPDLRSTSVLLVRAERRPGVRDIVASIDDLGRVLDYRHDPIGSTAVARAVVSRIEVLAATPGVEVSIAGVTSWPAVRPGLETHQILVGRDAAASVAGHLEVREGRVVAVGTDGSSAPWLAADFVLLRVGSQPARVDQVSTLYERRRQLALVDAGGLRPGSIPSVEEPYRDRAARARQSSRAERIVWATLAGDAVTARSTYREALAQPGATEPLADKLVSGINTVGDYWLLDAVLNDQGGDDLPPALRANAVLVRERLGFRLDQLLGLGPSASLSTDEYLYIPVVTPIVFEVSDALVPFVDARQDDGRFLYELVPAMRDRILARTGVTVPGVRARGNPSLAPGDFQVQVGEIPVLTGRAVVDGSYVLLTPDEAGPDPGGEPTNVHPRTGDRGLWLLRVAGAEGGPGERLTTAEYLAHCIGIVVRAHLTRFFGPQEVDSLVDGWVQQDDRGLVAATLPDDEARLRLTWVLQPLVDDGVPVTDWRAILEAINAAGGITVPPRELSRAVRARLREQLSGPVAGDRVVRVPEPLEATLLTGADRRDAVGPGEPRLEFLRWLHQTVAESGPVISLVTGGQDARELVASLARSEHPFITTLSKDELSPR